jgi:hypothetical protein
MMPDHQQVIACYHWQKLFEIMTTIQTTNEVVLKESIHIGGQNFCREVLSWKFAMAEILYDIARILPDGVTPSTRPDNAIETPNLDNFSKELAESFYRQIFMPGPYRNMPSMLRVSSLL